MLTAGAEQAVDRAVGALGIAAEVMACDPDLADTAAFCEAYGVDPQDAANTILVSSRRGAPATVACVALATTRLDVNGVVRRELGARKASFADPDETARLTGMVLGGVTPFGLPEGMPVLVDAAVVLRERVVVGGGSRSRKLRVAPASLLRLSDARVVQGLARPRDSGDDGGGG
jgi:prolyl-tRNA editing enzyme YbaK/EbsC (Cys-tRNA(Pro) deacylase)